MRLTTVLVLLSLALVGFGGRPQPLQPFASDQLLANIKVDARQHQLVAKLLAQRQRERLVMARR